MADRIILKRGRDGKANKAVVVVGHREELLEAGLYTDTGAGVSFAWGGESILGSLSLAFAICGQVFGPGIPPRVCEWIGFSLISSLSGEEVVITFEDVRDWLSQKMEAGL